jgi:hypothetical protein
MGSFLLLFAKAGGVTSNRNKKDNTVRVIVSKVFQPSLRVIIHALIFFVLSDKLPGYVIKRSFFGINSNSLSSFLIAMLFPASTIISSDTSSLIARNKDSYAAPE